MPYEITAKRCGQEIDRARDDVADAMEKYSRGGNLRAVNEASRRLADAQARMREITGLRVPDRR